MSSHAEPHIFNSKMKPDTSSPKSFDSTGSIHNLSPVNNMSLGNSCKTSPRFETLRPSEPQGMRDRANILVAHFGGEILSIKKLSIVKGAEAFKFKCINGHIFYKFVTEL